MFSIPVIINAFMKNINTLGVNKSVTFFSFKKGSFLIINLQYVLVRVYTRTGIRIRASLLISLTTFYALSQSIINELGDWGNVSSSPTGPR